MTERLRQMAERLFMFDERLRPSARPLRLEFERVLFEPERLCQERTTGSQANLAPFTLLMVNGANSSDGRRLICGNGCDNVALGQDANEG
jgi:hypothetical protein